MGKLTAAGVGAQKTPGRYGDGDGLFLLVGPSGGKSWMCRVQKAGRRRDIGLGSFKKVPLAEARKRAEQIRIQVEAGIDPVAERRRAAGIPTFRVAAAIVYAEQSKAWKNRKHQGQWLTSLETHAFPTIGDMAVNAIDTGMVRDLLADIWLTKNETARRVRQRINAIMDWACAKGYREAALPMAVVNRSLPKNAARVKHHAALAYADLPDFMTALRQRETMGRLALEALILTATRSGEVRAATWAEFDLDAGLWTIPAERMKAGREHVVPLSPTALALFLKMKRFKVVSSDLVFPGQAKGKPLSDMTLAKVLRDMDLVATPHGFRSTFRDWVAEATQFQSDLAEAALAHVIADKTVAAYQRGTMLEKRRTLMNAWADFADGRGAKVVRLAVPA